MRRDPFLNRFFIVLDRLSAWLWLTAIIAAVTWYAVWQKGFGFSGADTGWQFIRLVTGRADQTTFIVSLLVMSNAILLASLMSVWLFKRWQRSGELRKEHLRGTRLGDDQ